MEAAAAEARVGLTLPDGKVLAAGVINAKISAMRFSAAGVLDPTFGTSGIKTSTLLATTVRYAPATNKLVGLVGAPPSSLTLVRTATDGTPDATLGTGGSGSVTVTIPAGFIATDLIAQADGRILVTGSIYPPGQAMPTPGITLLRFTPAGLPDTAFGQGGVVTIDITSSLPSASASHLGLSKDGKLFVSGLGRATPGAPARVFVAKVEL